MPKPKPNAFGGVFAKPKATAAVEADKPAVKVTKAGYVTPSRVGTRGQLVHLNPAAKKQMRYLAADLDRPQESRVKEALNMLFEKYGKEQIA